MGACLRGQLSRGGKATTVASALEQVLITRFAALGLVTKPFLLRPDNGLVERVIRTLEVIESMIAFALATRYPKQQSVCVPSIHTDFCKTPEMSAARDVCLSMPPAYDLPGFRQVASRSRVFALMKFSKSRRC